MRIALGIEYDGAQFYGWQRQHKFVSVQEHLENALSKVANRPIDILCAGRTDAGVHATGQVVHFECEEERPERAWTMGVNANLPATIAVNWARDVPDDFHARFSASARRYRYVIYNSPLRPGIHAQGVTHIYQPLDEVKMYQASRCLLGENDFSSFRAAMCQSNTPWRNIHHIEIERFDRYIVIDIKANAFVHHMVRNITGALVAVGSGEKPIEWVAEVLAAKDRRQSAATAKPNGLYLVEVTYPEHFGLPKQPTGPLFLPERHF